MKHTNRQTTHRTLTDLYRAIDRRTTITITYRDRDGSETVRTLEPYEVRTTSDGDIALVAMCRLRGDERHFRLSRIRSYTLHRAGFVLDRPAPTVYERDEPAPTHSEAAIVAFELGRDKDDADYRPRRRLAQGDTDLAA